MEKSISKSVIYYTDNRLDDTIMSICQRFLESVCLPIVSVSLEPMNFGENIVFKGERGYPTMAKQILTALEASTATYVFFCEHDVLYHPSHFEFTPHSDSLYFYNTNDWRWDYPHDRLITYAGLTSLSQMCCNRELAIDHYRRRIKAIEENSLDKMKSHEPKWARKWGYEPGTKKARNGGFSDEKSERWRSEYPNIDIRHKGTFSRPKVNLTEFKHLPDTTTWKEVKLDQIPGWDLREIFNL